MKLEERYSAKQVAGLALGGSLWVFLSITCVLLPLPDPFPRHGHTDAVWLSVYLLWLVVSIAILVAMYQATSAFQRGISDDVWKKDEIDQLRTYFSRSAVNAALWVFLAFTVGYLVIDIVMRHSGTGHHRSSLGAFAYFWLSPVTVIGKLRQALRPRRERQQRLWRDQVKPIVSAHWGERGPA